MHSRDSFRVNNFDLIRLLAAAFVAARHALDQFGMHDHPFYHFTTWVPGVPIFFVVSGFLISKSYETNPKLAEYSLNRVLRVYPGLIVCTTVAMVAVVATGYLSTQDWSLGKMLAWLGGQVTIVQFYNPDFMRGFGSGVLNGALWTVTVELQFYVLTPIVYWLLARLTRMGLSFNAWLCVLIVVFALVNIAYHRIADADPKSMVGKLMMVTFLPWIFMFLFGMLAQRNFDRVHAFVTSGLGIATIIAAYSASVWTAVEWLQWDFGNAIHPIFVAPLTALTLVAAYNLPNLARVLLRKCDFSYGLYLYHMPVVNLMIYIWNPHELHTAALALCGAVVLGVISWFLVERPALRLKKHPLIDLKVRPATAV